MVEIIPPAVETDLHRERVDPDDNKRAKGNKMALTVEEVRLAFFVPQSCLKTTSMLTVSLWVRYEKDGRRTKRW